MHEECQAEMRAGDPEKTVGLLTTAGVPSIGRLVNCEDFRSLHRLLAVTVMVLRFCQFLLAKVRMDASTPSADDLNMAETLWIVEAQKEFVRDVHFSQWNKQFHLFQDDDKLWRCRGRIQNVNCRSQQNTPFCYQEPIF